MTTTMLTTPVIPMPRRPVYGTDLDVMIDWHTRMELRCAAMAWWAQANKHAMLASRLEAMQAIACADAGADGPVN